MATNSNGGLSADYSRTSPFTPRERAALLNYSPIPPALFTKLKGGNIAPKPGGYAWKGLFGQWDWENWIKPQIDRLIALGGNAVRLIGAPGSIFIDPWPGNVYKISQSTYDAHWAQIADYCLDKGLYLYPCLIAKWDVLDVYGVGGDYRDATMTESVKATAAMLSTYPNVIGFDLFQEGDAHAGLPRKASTAYSLNAYMNNSGNSYKATTAGTTDATAGPTGTGTAITDGTVVWAYQEKALMPADVIYLMNEVRKVSNLPLTMSRSIGDGFGWNDTTSMWSTVFNTVGGADFLDMHLYTDGIQPSDPDFLVNRSNKSILVGEYGAAQSASDAVKTARFNAVAAIHNRKNVKGSFFWALADQKTSANPEDQWGVWDNTGYVGPAFPGASTAPLSITSGKRSVMTDLLPVFNIADKPDRYEPKNMLSPTQAVSANGTTTATLGWVSSSNTYFYSESRGIGFSAQATGITFITTAMNPEWRIPVNPSSYYRGKIAMLAGTTPRTVSFNIDWYDSDGVYLTVGGSSAADTGTDHPIVPKYLEVEVRSPATAAYAVMVAKVTDATMPANEAHIVLRNPERWLTPA